MSTGCEYLDKLIGNLESSVITTIYGTAGTGKTCTCMLVAAHIAKSKGKVLYVDTEGGFSIERFKQITGDDFSILLPRLIFLKPVNFEEQIRSFETLKEKITEDIRIVIVDTIGMLYRLELGKDDIYRKFSILISYLSEIARTFNIPVLVTNQVYSNMENGTRMVGGDTLLYSSKCLIELEKGNNGMRVAILKKHRSIEEKKLMFKIVQEGVQYNSLQ